MRGLDRGQRMKILNQLSNKYGDLPYVDAVVLDEVIRVWSSLPVPLRSRKMYENLAKAIYGMDYGMVPNIRYINGVWDILERSDLI